MSRTPEKVYERRIETLKRRKDFLDKRVADYQGKDMSRDLAEASALHWALGVIEGNYEYSVQLIREQQLSKSEAKL
jgi:hypothetical protein